MIYKPADLCLGSFSISDEPWLLRTISRASGTRVRAFEDAVRARDNGCVVSGRLVQTMNNHRFFEGFEAAHVFPLAYEGHWQDHKYAKWITQVPEVGGTINSVQNGLLLSNEVHQLFDTYCLSINPDVRDTYSVFPDVLPLIMFQDQYKIICFAPSARDFAGRHLPQDFLNSPERPPDQLFRWHFRQAVLANMKGAGEPTYEHEFPPGSDIMGDIINGSKAVERMEFEISSRLAVHTEIV